MLPDYQELSRPKLQRSQPTKAPTSRKMKQHLLVETNHTSLSFLHLEKVDNNATYNMVKGEGKTWYWCPNHCYINKGVVMNGMYIAH
jgi:hypothetical protein